MENVLDNLKFSKIGTNPMKYFKNYLIHINHIQIGGELNIQDYKIIHEGIVLFKSNSDATFRQNIDAWIWMGFLIKKQKNILIKIIPNMTEIKLLDHSKYSLFLDNDNQLVNRHRKTIIIKLLSLHFNKSFHRDLSFLEIKKECGRYEEILIKDSKFMNLLITRWGDK